MRAWRRVNRTAEGREGERRHLNRELSLWVDDDGMVVVRGRLTPEVGAVVQRALEAAADRLFREARLSPTGATLTEDVTSAQRRADALGLLAEAALSADLDPSTAGDRYQVVLHVDAAGDEVAKGHAPSSCAHRLAQPRAEIDGGVLELDHDAHRVSAETSRRIACDAAVVPIHHDANGDLLDVGRRTRTVPPSIRRALSTRDRTCRFPGCTSRRCDAHHIDHWADGGATSLDNLVLLCRRHHRAVHEGGFRVEAVEVGSLAFWRPDGERLDMVPPQVQNVVLPQVGMDPPRAWDGTRFDVAWAIDVLWRQGSSEADRVSPAGEFGL